MSEVEQTDRAVEVLEFMHRVEREPGQLVRTTVVVTDEMVVEPIARNRVDDPPAHRGVHHCHDDDLPERADAWERTERLLERTGRR